MLQNFMKENELNPTAVDLNDMQQTELTQELALEWLRRNRDFLNLRAIANQLDCSPATLTVAVAGGKDSRGYDVPFPKRCLLEMQKIIQQFKED